MRVVIRSDLFVQSPDFDDQLSSALSALAKDLFIPEQAIGRLIVAGEEEYGPAIIELDERESFTDDGVNKGTGKTIASRQSDGSILSNIVIRDYIVFGLSTQASQEDKEQSVYLVAHELGHCRDNHERPQDRIAFPEEGFKIRDVARYYVQILLSEFSACVHSGRAVTEGVFKSDLEAFQNTTEEYFERLDDDDGSCLGRLAFRACGTFWYVLIQYAKLIGSKIGNPTLPQVVLWRDADEGDVELFGALSGHLLSKQEGYPNWSNQLDEELLEIWLQFALAYGYDFVEVESSENDALYLNII